MEFIERENEILTMLKSMGEAKLDFVVVGGYAVSALARHRFSVDCDVMIPKTKLEEFGNTLAKKGFRKLVEKAGFDEAYGGAFVSYKKLVGRLPVTFDLLVGSLICRATEAAWSYEYVNRHSVEAIVAGTQASVPCRIPERELLITFKVHSARRTDVRDLVMLIENAELEKIVSHLKRGNIEALAGQVKKVVSMLKDENLVDSLKGVFTLTADVKKQIEKTRKVMDNILAHIGRTP
jgi:hypothetical protein